MMPLQGITVVAVEQAVAAPFASRQLADLGARVIKIERPGVGDFARSYDTTVKGLASHFVWTNRSKESLTLDLKRPEAADVLTRLVAKADVFMHNLAPGAVGRLGFGSETLRARYPRLVTCEISGYGSSGPYRDKKAYDLLVQSEAGLVSITGTGDTPSKVGISIADIAAGMYAFSGVLAALLRRAQTGQGSVVEVSMFDALAEWMGYPAYFTEYGGTAPARSGAHHASIAPYGPYLAGDGQPVYLGLQNEREWARFCVEVLGRPELVDDERFASNSARVAHQDALNDAITRAFAGLSAADVVARLDAAGIANARMNSMREFLDHPQLAARGRWREVASPAGTLRALVPPIMLDDAGPVMGSIPGLGEHTDAILGELGYDVETIARWHERGII
jgi:crotonobetainyl-CoA:carnitine CoA-transferase CaiB-like acyl-CoA transferase